MKIGFSTGALARGDVRRGLEMQRDHSLGAIELSALRESELPRLIELIPHLDLTPFENISVHAPSRLTMMSETELCDLLARMPEWPIIVHPDIINDFVPWRALGTRICIENMDRRKDVGQTAADLTPIMNELPAARFCLDVAHAEQIDPTMDEARRLLERFGERLIQVHVSRLGSASEHLPLDDEMKVKIGRIASRISNDIPLIIESVVEQEGIEREIAHVAEAFGE